MDGYWGILRGVIVDDLENFGVLWRFSGCDSNALGDGVIVKA